MKKLSRFTQLTKARNSIVFVGLLLMGLIMAMDKPLAQEARRPNRLLLATHFFTESRTFPPVDCAVAGCTLALGLIGDEPINCPLAVCTFEIEVCSQVTIHSFGDALLLFPLVDLVPPTPGPVDESGAYFLERPSVAPIGSLVSHCTTFVDSGNTQGRHVFHVSVGARDLTGDGASINANSSKVTVRVYTP